MLVMLFLFAIALIAAPVVAAALGHALPFASSAIMSGAGVTIAIVSITLLVITRLYVKTKASEAFVRTGMGGMKIIKDGGALVIPVVHQIVRITLETIRLEVSRENNDALITKDKLRADVRAEFFVRVEPKDETIQNAARSFGDKMCVPDHVRKLVEDKLVSALRSIAATMTLEELNSERDKFMTEVMGMVKPTLDVNGLNLETATISRLDQTDPKNLRDDNIFDAQGKRIIVETTQAQLTKRNELERKGEQARLEQDVAAKSRMLDLQRTQAEATAKQEADISQVQAEQSRLSQVKQVDTARAVEMANIDKAKAIEVATREQQQAVEVAERTKQAKIAEASALQANAEAKLAEAEKARETAKQAITMVEVQTKAERDKATQIIAAQAAAEQKTLEAKQKIEAEALTIERVASAKLLAAKSEAEGVEKTAIAKKVAALADAEGQKAIALVPVEVEARKVDVDKRRVEEVLKPEFQARNEFGRAAQDFELAQLRITKAAEVQIAVAGAIATFSGKIEAKVFGTPDQVGNLVESFRNGMGFSTGLAGLLEGMDDQTKSLVGTAVSAVGDMAKRVLDGKEKPEEDPIKAAAEKQLAERAAPAAPPAPAAPTTAPSPVAAASSPAPQPAKQDPPKQPASKDVAAPKPPQK
ncbi:MAG: SPFH domain-containing protein [Patescibacteria group bacterium]